MNRSKSPNLCPECRSPMKHGRTRLDLDRADFHIEIDDVDAHICAKCGETTISANTAKELFKALDIAVSAMDNSGKQSHKTDKIKFKIASISRFQKEKKQAGARR